MVGVSLFCKAACIVAFAKVLNAYPATFSQPSDSNVDGHEYLRDESLAQDHPSIEWRALVSNADSSSHIITDGFIKVLADPAFPKHSMRYKTPDICDPTVKQVCCYTIPHHRHLPRCSLVIG